MKKWILPLLYLIVIFSGLTACSIPDINWDPTNVNQKDETGAEEFDWDDIVLGEIIPAPQSSMMKVSRNDRNTLYTDVFKISANEFMQYIRLCETAGFNVDATRSGNTMFSARNAEGYVLNLTYNDSEDKMTISLMSSGLPSADQNPEPEPEPEPKPEPSKSVNLNAEEIYAKCASAVFYIEIYNQSGYVISSGSGVFISADGKALTNHHVIEDAYSAKIMTNDGKVYTVSGYYDSQAAIDMALIQVDGTGFPHLTMGDSTKLAAGQEVFAIGSPKGLDDTISQGIISNVNRVVDGLSYIQMTAPISSGSSGGALINAQGLLIGLNAAAYIDAQNLNLAVPIHLFRELSSDTLHPFPVRGGSSVYYDASLSFNTSLNLTTGETGTVTISADPGSCTEDITIRWDCDDESIVTPTWDEWNEWDINLYVTGVSSGSTTITISLLSESGTLLTSRVLYVNVSSALSYSGASLTFNTSLSITAGSTDTVTVTADPGNCTEDVTIRWECDNTDIVTPKWDEWDGWNIDLHVKGLVTGSAKITITLLTDNGTVLATRVLYVTVSSPSYSGASLTFNSSLTVSAGSTGIATITADPGNYDGDVTIRWECADESIVSPEWDEWYGWNVDLFVTGLRAGSTTITISLLSEDETVLASKVLYVTVSNASNRQVAFNKLRDWIISNTNTTMSGDPAYSEIYQETTYFVLTWDSENQDIKLQVGEFGEDYTCIITTALTAADDWSLISITYTYDPAPQYSFSGSAKLYYATFSEYSDIEFFTYEGSSSDLDSFENILKLMLLNGLDFTDIIFDEHIPGYSIRDLGFTNA